MTSDELPPQTFPIQVVDRVIFTATQVFLCVFSTRGLAQEIAARLNAGEMWRLGLEPAPEPVPDAEQDDAEDESGGWALTGATIQSNSVKP